MSQSHATPPRAPGHNASRFTTTASGGRRLSDLQLPWFQTLPPRGFGVLTTRGRKTGQPRQTCVRAARDGQTVYLAAIAGERAGWLRNIRADPRVTLRIRGGTFEGVARDVSESERQRGEDVYARLTG